MDFTVRQATADDSCVLAAFLQRLVSLRNEPGLRTQNAKDLYRDGFAKNKPRFAAFLAESSNPEKEVIGFALFSYRYHSFIGRGLHLNNLFVLEPHRGKGVATQLLKRVIRAGLRQGCHNMGFMSNSWNHIAKNLYKKMGAINLTESHGLHAYEYVTLQNEKTAPSCSHQINNLEYPIIRKARPDDVREITRLLKLHKESQNVSMLEDIEESVLRTNGFETSPQFFAYVAEKKSTDSEAEKCLVGVLTYSYAYCSHSSTTISLDTVYVEEFRRREGIACALFHTCRQEEAVKNHTKIRIFVDSSIDGARHFFNHVNVVDQSERAQWIWSIVPHEDLVNYTLTDQNNESTLENGSSNHSNGGEASPNVLSNGTTPCDEKNFKADATLNGITNAVASLKLAASADKSVKSLSNDESSLKSVSNGDAIYNGMANGDVGLKVVENGDVPLKRVVNGGEAPSKSVSNLEHPLSVVTNGYACDGLLVNGDTQDL